MLTLRQEGTPEPETEWRIVITRKLIRHATERNRWRRRIREVLRGERNRIQAGCCATLRLHHAGAEPPYAELALEIVELLRRADLLKHS